MTNWFVYIAECNDGSLYTGITVDIKRREKEHNTDSKLGAKSLRGKRPVKIVYFEKYETQSEARKREAAIKKWHRESKINLIKRTQEL
ncbi:MAG: Endo/excinuclease amino terminal domain protein [Candidatus Gottesmanbacteria bacterium GW2011_GWC2_39_8]|uniref:Endo/excinuclease amino terminal domain protein n=1 Tax=Candidatus Gottesmanbacteria bacterium GW2011_GWC2_39_8 TaxID=1618450 RepID=A0A0G0PW49_9BACT|nr:MAG: Endo/excinuclease amino terminal domain protein [Candidatus Gottesmanbacteria bacterium GW2011_GWC2_39_8]